MITAPWRLQAGWVFGKQVWHTLRRGQWSRSRQWLRQAIAFDPSYAPALQQLGEQLAQDQRWDEAIRAYRAAIAHDPQLPWAHYHLAGALLAIDQPQGAIAHYQIFLQHHPRFMWGHHGLGSALERLGQWSDAATTWTRAIRLEPMQIEPRLHLALVQAAQNQVTPAIATCTRALTLVPDPPLAQAFYALRAQLRDRQGDTLRAIGDYQQAIRLLDREPDPWRSPVRSAVMDCWLNLIPPHNLAGLVQACQRDLIILCAGDRTAVTASYLHLFAPAELSIAACHLALVTAPHNPQAHLNLAIALHHHGDPWRAIAYCHSALHLRPHWPAALIWRSHLESVLRYTPPRLQHSGPPPHQTQQKTQQKTQ
jgi:tetratricopeptide (TPR) repeat protein